MAMWKIWKFLMKGEEAMEIFTVKGERRKRVTNATVDTKIKVDMHSTV